MKRALTSNRVIDLLASTRRFITRTHTRKGVVLTFDDTFEIVPAPVVERMIAKGIVISAGDGLPIPGGQPQTYRLSPSWGGRS